MIRYNKTVQIFDTQLLFDILLLKSNNMQLIALCLFIFTLSATAQQPWVPAPQTPQSWFPNPNWWNERFQSNIANSLNNGPLINVLFLGDSITEGWLNVGRQTWDQAFSPLWASNYAIPGDGIQHVLYRIINGEVQNISPRIIVLKVGEYIFGIKSRRIVKFYFSV